MKLFTERNLLYIYVPLDFHNPHKKNYALPISKNGTVVYGEYWGADEYMLIDILADWIRNGLYRKIHVDKKLTKNKQSYFTKEFIDNLISNSLPAEKVIKFDLRYKDIRRNYPFMSKFPPKKFSKLIEQTSKIKLQTHYKVKLRYEYKETEWDPFSEKRKNVKKKFDSKVTIDFKTPQSLFNYVIESATGNYRFIFDTGLGLSFVNNILMFEWERLPFEFYNLSKNAQNLYRRLILPKKEGTKVEHPLDVIAEFLNFGSPNQTVKKDAVERVLNELKANKYIDWERKKGFRETIMAIEKTISN
jgi:hypothetical protein